MKRNAAGIPLDLDAMTYHLLDHLAQTWGVSKEEAVRRALEQADATAGQPAKAGRLEAFQELQRRLSLTPAKATEWQDAVREARRQ